MNNFTYINEILTNGYQLFSLDLISFISILSSILVIITRNPVISVLFLIVLFINIACYLILIGINFIGLTYILVYVGAIAVLFLFIIMLLNIKLSELQTDNYNALPLGTIVGIMFLYPIYTIIPSSLNQLSNFSYSIFHWFNWLFTNIQLNNINNNNNNKVDILWIYQDKWDLNLIPYTQISSIGNIMYTNYSILFLIISFILLLAMVGSIVLSLKQIK